ncbi:ice-binding family protein [Lysobacter korlensis]|uniref:Ice-binding family protein n=1 Tax=Lysobacter korlensis TaxID=553636 RepID=A0ABV6RYF2_9GAMM
MTTSIARNAARVTACAGIAVALSVGSAMSAGAAADGPIELGSASGFGVLAGSAVTSTVDLGTVITGDLGLSPEPDPAAITGFPPALLTGTAYQADAVAGDAQTDLGTAIVEAAGRTPLQSGLTELGGLDLGPGTYSGGALQVTGTLTLTGDANSVFIFQAASTLVTAPNAEVLLEGGATWCNVFWQVGSSATLDTATDFVGTVMASASITANAGTDVAGRLLAQSGAVTMNSTTVDASSACALASAPVDEEEPTDDGDTPDDTDTGGDSPDDTDTGGDIGGGDAGGDGDGAASAPELAETGADLRLPLGASMLLLLGGGLTLALLPRLRRAPRIR